MQLPKNEKCWCKEEIRPWAALATRHFLLKGPIAQKENWWDGERGQSMWSWNGNVLHASHSACLFWLSGLMYEVRGGTELKEVTLLWCCRGQTLISSARLKRLSWRSLMYSDFTLLFQQAGPFSERFPVSTMVNLQTNKETLTASTSHTFLSKMRVWAGTITKE